MKFSELLTQYINERDEEREASEWESIEQGILRRLRMTELLTQLDEIVTGNVDANSSGIY